MAEQETVSKRRRCESVTKQTMMTITILTIMLMMMGIFLSPTSPPSFPSCYHINLHMSHVSVSVSSVCFKGLKEHHFSVTRRRKRDAKVLRNLFEVTPRSSEVEL